MARRTFLRYTRAEQLSEEERARYIRFFPPAELYHHRERFPQLTSTNLFGNIHPLEVEIGCGSAEPLCSLAQAHPHINYLGIDISGPSIHKAAELAAKRQLHNILFIHADFQQLTPLLVPQSLRAVYLHFPDPHTKSGYKKRRIFTQAFLETLSQTLETKGLLSVMTDHQERFMDMLLLLETDPRFVKMHQERYLLGFEHEVKSHFQRIWEHHGETVYRFVAHRQEL